MGQEEKNIVSAFLAAHAEIYPDEDDRRDMLDPDKLVADAKALLAYGLAGSSIEELVLRDMRRRPGLGMTSPSTIRFCVKSVEAAAKAGGTMKGRALANIDQHRHDIRRQIGQDDFSAKDRDHVCKADKIEAKKDAYAILTIAEKWRWHAYMRVRWWNAKGSWPPPFDKEGNWRDADFDRWAFQALMHRHTEWYPIGERPKE